MVAKSGGWPEKVRVTGESSEVVAGDRRWQWPKVGEDRMKSCLQNYLKYFVSSSTNFENFKNCYHHFENIFNCQTHFLFIILNFFVMKNITPMI